MITIIEDGMEYVLGEKDSDGCKYCKAQFECDKGGEIGNHCGGKICLSAKKITSEPKVYGPHNRCEAAPLVHSTIEYFDGTWKRGVLTTVMGYQTNLAYRIGRTEYPIIREIPTRHLTWPKSKHSTLILRMLCWWGIDMEMLSFLCFSFAAMLALCDTDGWGWFLFVGIILL